MKKLHFIIALISALILFSYACSNDSASDESKMRPESTTNFTTIADTIIYDVVIKNPDINDKWTEQCLSKLEKEILIDRIFEAIYDNELIPFDFFEGEKLSISDIKELEKREEFSREKIAKVQFEEIWYFDEKSLKMTKEVYSIMLAYEIYNSFGEIKGYKPAFKVYFK